MAERGVLATFAAPADAARAVRALRDAGFRVDAAMPAPYPDLVAALGKPRSGLGRVALFGALLGLACGAALTAGTSSAWPLVTGGKPIVSVPPFVIVTFELTVLVGALANLVAVLVGGLRGARRQAALFRGRTSNGWVNLHAAGGDPAIAARILRECGAREVDHE
jgi:hypothetical protein